MKFETWSSLNKMSETISEIDYLREVMKYGVLNNEQISKILSDISESLYEDWNSAFEAVRGEFDSYKI